MQLARSKLGPPVYGRVNSTRRSVTIELDSVTAPTSAGNVTVSSTSMVTTTEVSALSIRVTVPTSTPSIVTELPSYRPTVSVNSAQTLDVRVRMSITPVAEAAVPATATIVSTDSAVTILRLISTALPAPGYKPLDR